jgi:ABC-type multidrug transport system permease subunit
MNPKNLDFSRNNCANDTNKKTPMKQAQRKIPHNHVISPFAKLFVVSTLSQDKIDKAILFRPVYHAIYNQRRFTEIWHALVKPDRFCL